MRLHQIVPQIVRRSRERRTHRKAVSDHRTPDTALLLRSIYIYSVTSLGLITRAFLPLSVAYDREGLLTPVLE